MKLPSLFRSTPKAAPIEEEDVVEKVTTTTYVTRKPSPVPAVVQNPPMFVQNITPPPTPAPQPLKANVTTTTNYGAPGAVRTITRTLSPPAAPPTPVSPQRQDRVIETTTVETVTYPFKTSMSPPPPISSKSGPSIPTDVTTIGGATSLGYGDVRTVALGGPEEVITVTTTTKTAPPPAVGYPSTPYHGDIKPIPYCESFPFSFQTFLLLADYPVDYSAMIKRTPPRRNRLLEFTSPYISQNAQTLPPPQTIRGTTVPPRQQASIHPSAYPPPATIAQTHAATQFQPMSRSHTPLQQAPVSILQRAKTLLASPTQSIAPQAPRTVASIQMDIDRDADGNEHVHAKMYDYTQLPQRGSLHGSALGLGVGGNTPMVPPPGDLLETKSDRKERKKREKEEERDRRADERQRGEGG